jgi:hypothetical protein
MVKLDFLFVDTDHLIVANARLAEAADAHAFALARRSLSTFRAVSRSGSGSRPLEGPLPA